VDIWICGYISNLSIILPVRIVARGPEPGEAPAVGHDTSELCHRSGCLLAGSLLRRLLSGVCQLSGLRGVCVCTGLWRIRHVSILLVSRAVNPAAAGQPEY